MKAFLIALMLLTCASCTVDAPKSMPTKVKKCTPCEAEAKARAAMRK